MKLPVRSEDLDANAAEAQRAFLILSRVQLGVIVAAAVVVAYPLGDGGPTDWQAFTAASFFAASLVLRFLALKFRDEERWRTSRNHAERSKSLCFQFAYGATGFERDLDEATALRRLREASIDLPEIVAEHPVGQRGFLDDATDEMRARRRLSDAQARVAYDTERISDQANWFARKAKVYRTTSRRYLIAMVTAELAGLVFALLAVTTSTASGLVGVCTTVAAATIAWTQVRQHSALATAYLAQAGRLRTLARQIPDVTGDRWPAFVTRVEESLLQEGEEWLRLMGHER